MLDLILPLLTSIPAMILYVVIFAVILFKTVYIICPQDQILIVSGLFAGRTKDGKGDAVIYQGGGCFVLPGLQTYRFLSLTPRSISLPLDDLLTSNNIRIEVPSTIIYTVDNEQREALSNAARYLSSDRDIEELAKETVVGEMRAVISKLTIEEINQDRNKLRDEVASSLNEEFAKIGLKVITVNIRDIKDETNYITSLGAKATAEVTNKANIDVATQQRIGAEGVATQTRDREINVNQIQSEEAIQVANIRAEQATKVAQTEATQEVAVNQTTVDRDISIARAKAEQVAQTADINATQVKATNSAKLIEVQSNTELQVRSAVMRQESEVATAKANTEINNQRIIERSAEMSIEVVAQAETQKKELQIQAEAYSKNLEIRTQAEAEAVLVRAQADAKAIQLQLEAKAAGMKKLIEAAGSADAAVNLLLIEKMEEIMKIQVEALKNIKIDSLTVWGGNGDGKGGIQSVMKDYMGCLPQLHELAKQVGITLPGVFGAKDD